jgi:hypothetical protein
MATSSADPVPTEPLYGDPSDAHSEPRHGDYVKVRGGNVHIVLSARPGSITSACNGWYSDDLLSPANGDQPRQCPKCGELM